MALTVLAFGGLLTLGTLVSPAFNFFTKLVPACAAAVAILIYPLFGLVIAFLLSGLSQLAVLVPDFFSFAKLAALISGMGYLRRGAVEGNFGLAAKSKVLFTYSLPAVWFTITGIVGDATVGEKIARLYNMTAVIALAHLVCLIPRNIREIRTAMLSILIGCAAIGPWIMFFGASGQASELYEEVEGVTVYYDHNLAIQLGMGVMCSIALLASRSKNVSLGVIALDAVLVICILLTHSRSSWLGLITSSCIAFLWLGYSRGFKVMGKLSVILLAVAVVLLLSLRQSLLAPVLELVMPRVEFSLTDATTASTGRLDFLWPNAIAFIQGHPLIGGGLAGGAHYFTAHNALLEAGIEGGGLGMLLYLISVPYTVFGAVRSADAWLAACSIALGSFVVVVSQTNPSSLYSIPYGFAVGFVAWAEIHDVRPDSLAFTLRAVSYPNRRVALEYVGKKLLPGNSRPR